MFYITKLYSSYLSAGESYGKLERTVSILILDHNHIQDEHYEHLFELYDAERKIRFSDGLKIQLYELRKYREQLKKEQQSGTQKSKEHTLKEAWLDFLSARSKEEMEMATKTSPAIRKAGSRLMQLTEDEMAILKYEQELKIRRDREAVMAAATNEGLRKGIEQGRQEGQEEILRKLINKYQAKGYSEEEICDLLDISTEQYRLMS